MLFFYSCPKFFPFSILCPSHPPILQASPTLFFYVCGSFIHVLLPVPPLSFQHYPSPCHCQSVLCFHLSGSFLFVSLFCSLDFSYRWDHMVFFFHWLISLSIMFSSSIHAVTKGKSSLFLSFCRVVVHCVNVAQFFDPLIYWWALRLFLALGYFI